MSSGLQNKMYNYELNPPPGVWEKIAATLEESEPVQEFPAKLYGLEVDPPGTAWENIKTSLAEIQPGTPGKRRLMPWLRYAAAAVMVGFIAWGSILFLHKGSGNNKLASEELIQPGKVVGDAISKNNDNTGNNITISDTDETRNDAALEASKKTFAKLDVVAGSKIKKITNNYFDTVEPVNEPEKETFSELHFAGGAESLAHNYEINTNSSADRYITLMTPDGNIIRMSKKLSGLVCCVSGEEQDEDCKDQMETWRKKIACSSITSSPDNFMDILNLVNSLQENH